MDQRIERAQRSRSEWTGAHGNRLVGDIHLPADDLRGCVLLAHGGGQTRHSWRGTAEMLARAGWLSITLDQRGHGDSDWVADGNYSFEAYAADLREVARDCRARGWRRPVLVGASLGGLAGLMLAGRLDSQALSALVLVDITPEVKPDGVERILAFMAAKAEEGFASLDEAADAVAAYLPHRPRPASLEGLAKNLRKGGDGRYRWHWDPRFLDSRRDAEAHAEEMNESFADAARHIQIPVLLVRGRESELVGEAEAEAFRALVPHAEAVDVSGARHMVAGDRNDIFTDAIIAFLDRL